MYQIFDNIWLITIIGGAIASILAGILLKFFHKNKKAIVDDTQKNDQKTIVNNKIDFNMVTKEAIMDPSIKKIINNRELSFYKESTKILFIDDLDLKDKIRNLIKAGWKNVSQIKEAEDIDCVEIRRADIIFVDYKGIGKSSNEEGLAVIGALKSRYGNTKWIILHTAHDVPLSALDRHFDSYLGRNSSIYELDQKIVEGLGEIEMNK